MSLSVDLGHVLPEEPLHLPHLHCRNGSPSRQRRRVRRAEERARRVAENADRNEAGTGEASEKCVNQSNDNSVNLIEEGVVEETVISVDENVVEREFLCEMCDFKSNWQNGLSIHITRKHSK